MRTLGLGVVTRCRAAREIIDKAMSTATYEAALMKNAGPGPRVTSTSPPSPGPKARAALNWAELRVTALSRASRGTNSETKACQAGALMPVITPPVATRPMITGTDARPELQATPMAMATTAMALCVTNRMRRRSRRSASEPPSGDMSAIGAS